MSARALYALFLGGALLGGAPLMSACSGGPHAVIQRVDELPPPPAHRGFLKLTQCDERVRIYLNGRFKGLVADYPLRALLVPVGEQRLELRRRGYATVYRMISVSEERPVELQLTLTALPPPPPRPSRE